MLVEKAQEFPALFLVKERKKDAKGIRIQSLAALIPGFLYRISTAECLHHGVKPLGQPLAPFYATIISNR